MINKMQAYRDTRYRFSDISLADMSINNSKSGFQGLSDPLINKQQQQKASISQEIAKTKVADQNEWSVQKSQHLDLINDLSSNLLGFNRATQHWIDKIRRTEKTNGSAMYMDPSEKEQNKQLRQIKWKQAILIDAFPIIEPTSTTLIAWDTFQVTVILSLFFSTILSFYYTEPRAGQDTQSQVAKYWDFWTTGYLIWLHIFIMLMLSVDIFVEFHVAYFYHGSFITNRYHVAKNYFKTGFVFDIIPLMMLLIIAFVPALRHSEWFHLLLVLKINAIIKIDQRIKDRLQLHRKSKAGYLILRLIIEMYFMVHIFAAIFFRAGVFAMEHYEGKWQSWLNFEGGNFPAIYQMSKWDQFMLAMYWSFATLTTVAYGDITPMNPIEIQVSQIAMIFAVFFFAFNIQIMFEVVEEYRETQKKFQKYLIIVNRFMRDKQITPELQNKIRKYLDHIWQQQRAREESIEDQIINQLAPQLKEELMYESYGKCLLSIPWFKDYFSFEFVRELSQDVEEVHYTKAETLFLDNYGTHKDDDDDSSLYFINQGKAELFINIDQNNRNDVIIAKIREGSCFGQYSFITGQPKTCSARSVAYSQIYRVRRSKFLHRLQQFPADYEKFCYLRDQVQFNKRVDILNINCFTCNSPDHMAVSCPLSHYSSNQLEDISKQALKQAKEISINQERKKKRRQRKKNRNKVLITVEQQEQAQQIQEDLQNPEHIDNELAKLLRIQQITEPISQQQNEDIDQLKNFEHYWNDKNIDQLIRQHDLDLIVLSQPKKRAISKKFNTKMNKFTTDFAAFDVGRGIRKR